MRDRFPSCLEQEFRTDRHERNIRHHRRALLGILVVAFASGLLNSFVPLHERADLLRVHYLVLCPVLLSIYALSFRPSYRRWSQQFMIIGVLAFAGTYLIFEMLAPTPRGSEASRTTVVLIDVVLATSTLLRLRHTYVVGACCLLFGVYALLSFTVFQLPNPGWNTFALLTACVLGCQASSFTEQSARSDFLLRRKLESAAADRLRAAREAEHEIKNKLVSVRSPIELAERWLDRGMDFDRIRPHLQNALGSVKEMDRLLHNMLNLARMEAGHEPVMERPQFISLDRIVREVCEQKDGELRARREAEGQSPRRQALTQVIFERNAATPSTQLYPYSLLLVLQNFFENAVKYSPAGGAIRVRAWESNDELLVSIADEGTGIDPARLDGLFTHLYERGDGDAHSVTGMGIGLNLVKRLMDAQSGRVWAHSDGPGRGATFFLAIPLKPG